MRSVVTVNYFIYGAVHHKRIRAHQMSMRHNLKLYNSNVNLELIVFKKSHVMLTYQFRPHAESAYL